MVKSILAICVGASLGALLRWWLGLVLNGLFPTIPPGTLVANLVGGYLVGLAIAFFATYSALAPEWRLLVYSRPEAERGVDRALEGDATGRFEDLLRRTLRILSGR